MGMCILYLSIRKITYYCLWALATDRVWSLAAVLTHQAGNKTLRVLWRTANSKFAERKTMQRIQILGLGNTSVLKCHQIFFKSDSLISKRQRKLKGQLRKAGEQEGLPKHTQAWTEGQAWVYLQTTVHNLNSPKQYFWGCISHQPQVVQLADFSGSCAKTSCLFCPRRDSGPSFNLLGIIKAASGSPHFNPL